MYQCIHINIFKPGARRLKPGFLKLLSRYACVCAIKNYPREMKPE